MSANTRSRVIVGWISFFILLIGMFMISTLFMSTSAVVDYGHPVVAKWEKTKDGKQTATIKFEEISDEKVAVFQKQKLNLPFALTVDQLFLGSVFAIVFYFVLMGFVYDIEDDSDDRGIVILIALAALIVTTVIAGVYSVVIYNHQNYEQVIRKAFADSGLADEIVSFYKKDLSGNVIVLFIGMIVSGLIIGLLHYFLRYMILAPITRWAARIIRSYLRNYKERLFVELLQQRKDSIFNAFIDERRDDIEGLVKKSQDNLDSDNEVIQIFPNGVVEILKYRYEIEYKPLPIIVPRKDVVARISMDNLFRHLVAATKEEAFQELKELLLERYENNFQEAGKVAVPEFAKDIVKRTKNTFDHLSYELRTDKFGVSRDLAEKMLQRVSTNTLRKFKGEIAKIGSEEIHSMLTELRRDIQREIAVKVDRICDISNSSLQTHQDRILPPNTRFYFTSERYKIIAVEQPPLMRNILIDSRLSRETRDRRFNVAFPFVVFLMVFVDDQLSTMYAYYRNKPLQSIDDMLSIPNLTNVHNDCSVCLGFGGHNYRSGFIERVDEVITHFWNSQFNTDLNSNYNYYSRNEHRLENFSKWEKASQDDNLFPLSIEWRETSSLRDKILEIMSNIGGGEIAISEKVNREIEDVFTSGIEEFEESLLKVFSGSDAEDRYPDVITNIIKDYEDKVITDSIGTVAKSFSGICDDADLGDIMFGTFHNSVSKTMEEDFSQLAKEVLFRRRVNAQELIDKIKEENRRN